VFRSASPYFTFPPPNDAFSHEHYISGRRVPPIAFRSVLLRHPKPPPSLWVERGLLSSFFSTGFLLSRSSVFLTQPFAKSALPDPQIISIFFPTFLPTSFFLFKMARVVDKEVSFGLMIPLYVLPLNFLWLFFSSLLLMPFFFFLPISPEGVGYQFFLRFPFVVSFSLFHPSTRFFFSQPGPDK